MCLMQTRVHRCRHCTYTWDQPDHLDLCPEGEKLLLQHGHLCPLQQLAAEQGHHISQSQPESSGPPPSSYQRSQGGERSQGEQTYRGARQKQQREIEDMCEECKEKHMREWADEARGRAVQMQEPVRDQQQMREVQRYHQQYQYSYQGANGM